MEHISSFQRMYEEFKGTDGEVSLAQLMMKILKTLTPIFDRFRSACDSVHLVDRTLTVYRVPLYRGIRSWNDSPRPESPFLRKENVFQDKIFSF